MNSSVLSTVLYIYALTIKTLKKKFYNWPVVSLISHFHQVISKAVVFKEEPIHLRECLELCNGVQKENALFLLIIFPFITLKFSKS